MKTKLSTLNFAILLYFTVVTSVAQKRQVVSDPANPLFNYINSPDDNFDWRIDSEIQKPEGTYYELDIISQRWHGIIWKNRIIIFIPTRAEHPNTLLIVLRHLYDRAAGLANLKIISNSTHTPSAILFDVPNQPLFDGKEEDDLQAYTFSQYIKTGDDTWPLLFPMVKSVVRSMDAIQQLNRSEKKQDINSFVIAGHSKRGHTAWLTAAVDARVSGIIPIAIDILNSSVQLPHHLAVFGAYSTLSKDATDLLQELSHPRGKNLIEMVDAYSYRKQLTLPKLIVSATNDSFFTTDALNLYWEGLGGPKWILYLANANHVSAYSDPRVNPTAFAFVRAVAANKLLPELRWEWERDQKMIHLKIEADTSAIKARAWVSHSKNKDFREASWAAHNMVYKGISGAGSGGKNRPKKQYGSTLEIPVQGYIAIMGEVEFSQDGHVYLLSTQTNITSSAK